MTYYLLASSFLFFFTSFAYIVDRKSQVKLAFIIVTIFVIFCGLRWYSGKDYGAYTDIFMMMPTLSDFYFTDMSDIPGEIGYKFLNSLFKTMLFESYSTLFFIAAFSLYLKLFFYTKLPGNVFFCICFYLALHFYHAEFIQVRMSLGLAILCLAVLCYLKKDNLKFLISVFFASTIHSVCAVFVVLLLTRYFKLKSLLTLAFTLPILFSFVSVLRPLLDLSMGLFYNSILVAVYNYAYGVHGENVFIYNFTPLRHMVIVLALIVFYPKINELDDIKITLIKIYLIGIILSSFFMDIELLYSRAIYLFDIVEPIVLCMLIFLVRNLYLRAFAFFLASFFPLLLMSRAGLELLGLFEYSTWLHLIF